jgi:hypothetical protein
MFDPTDLIGGIYKVPAFILVLWFSFAVVYYYSGWPGVILTVIGACILATHWIKKDLKDGFPDPE